MAGNETQTGTPFWACLNVHTRTRSTIWQTNNGFHEVTDATPIPANDEKQQKHSHALQNGQASFATEEEEKNARLSLSRIRTHAHSQTDRPSTPPMGAAPAPAPESKPNTPAPCIIMMTGRAPGRLSLGLLLSALCIMPFRTLPVLSLPLNSVYQQDCRPTPLFWMRFFCWRFSLFTGLTFVHMHC